MNTKTETIELKLNYFRNRSDPSRKSFSGGVKDPQHLDRLAVWVDEDIDYDWNSEQFVPNDGYQVHISGTRSALFELGRYLVALSKYETEDPMYHDHFDDLHDVADKSRCKLIVHLDK